MLKVFENEDLVAEEIAREMIGGLTVSAPVFCLASGSTPAKGYQLFSEMVKNEDKIKALKIVSLDEWVGIKKESSGSCYQMLRQDLFDKVDLSEEQIVFFDGMSSCLDGECQRIDGFIKEQPITFSLMGVGMNGHIGLNEPGFPILDHSSVVELSESTKAVAQKYFTTETVLAQGISLGLQQIIDSQRVIVVITGEHKAEIVKETFMNKDAVSPAKELLGYEHIDFYLDKAAAKYLD